MRQKIVLDANFLIFAIKKKIRFMADMDKYDIGILQSVLDELKKLASGNSKDALAARIALQVVEDMEVFDVGGAADSALVELGKQGYIVATQDKELQDRVRKAGGKIAFVRQGKKVEIR